jgi:tetratricopeptide (TPR) repeat protein
VLELHAIAVKKAEGGGEFAVAMTALEKRRFLDGISEDFGAYYNMLGRVDVARSDCSRAADRESIHAGIRDSVGFGELGRMVFGVMEEWMVGELQAQAAAKREEGDERGEMAWCQVLGTVLGQQGRSDEAVEFEEKALAIGRRVLGEDDADLGVYMNNLAATYRALGRHEDALAMQESVLEFRRRVLPPNHPDIATSLYNISLSYETAGDMRRAVECAREALDIWRAALPPSHPHVRLAEDNVRRLEASVQQQSSR